MRYLLNLTLIPKNQSNTHATQKNNSVPLSCRCCAIVANNQPVLLSILSPQAYSDFDDAKDGGPAALVK